MVSFSVPTRGSCACEKKVPFVLLAFFSPILCHFRVINGHFLFKTQCFQGAEETLWGLKRTNGESCFPDSKAVELPTRENPTRPKLASNLAKNTRKTPTASIRPSLGWGASRSSKETTCSGSPRGRVGPNSVQLFALTKLVLLLQQTGV